MNLIENDYTELKAVYMPVTSPMFVETIEDCTQWNIFMVKPKFRIPRKKKKFMTLEQRLYTLIRLDTKWEIEHFLK